MKNLVIPVIIIILLISAFIFFNKPQTETAVPTPSPSPTPAQKVDIKAKFTIITGNIVRSFKAKKYHNQSVDVYLTADDSTIIHVKKVGVTYDDFLKTLPMKLTKECLITGDGETFCDDKDGALRFYLNDTETPDLLNKEIKDGDKVLIKFSP